MMNLRQNTSLMNRRTFLRAMAATCVAEMGRNNLAQASSGRRIALIITSGQFATHPLHGVQNDARMMADMLSFLYGYAPADISILGLSPKEQKAFVRSYNFLPGGTTRSSLMRHIKTLVSQVGPSDIGFVGYSGHGGMISDERRETKVTQYIVTQDAEPFFDFEIDRLTSTCAGQLMLFFDSCYSAGIARTADVDTDAFGQSKSVTLDQAPVHRLLYSLPAPPHASDSLPMDGRRVLLAAAGPEQTALEIRLPHGGKEERVGAFTYAVYHVVMRSSKAMRYSEIRYEVRKFLTSFPQLGSLPDNKVQGADYLTAFIPTTSGLVPSGLPIIGRRIPVGWLADVDAPMVFEGVDKPGIYVNVRAVGPFESVIEPIVPNGSLPTRVRVKFVPMKSIEAIQREATKAVENSPNRPIMTAGVHIRVLPNPQAPGGFDVVGETLQGRYKIANGVDAAQANDARQRQEDTLRSASQFGRSLAQNQLSHPFQLALTTSKGEDYPRFMDGESTRVSVRAERTGYLILLAFNPDGRTAILYPNQSPQYTPSVHLENEVSFPITAALPFGITRLVAILSSHPIKITLTQEENLDGLIEPAETGWNHYRVREGQLPAFTSWLQKQLAIPTTTSRNFGVSASDAANLISVDDIEIVSLDVVAEPTA